MCSSTDEEAKNATSLGSLTLEVRLTFIGTGDIFPSPWEKMGTSIVSQSEECPSVGEERRGLPGMTVAHAQEDGVPHCQLLQGWHRPGRGGGIIKGLIDQARALRSERAVVLHTLFKTLQEEWNLMKLIFE